MPSNSRVPRSFILMLGTYLPQNPVFSQVNWSTVTIEELAQLAGLPFEEFEANCLEVLGDVAQPATGDKIQGMEPVESTE